MTFHSSEKAYVLDAVYVNTDIYITTFYLEITERLGFSVGLRYLNLHVHIQIFIYMLYTYYICALCL